MTWASRIMHPQTLVMGTKLTGAYIGDWLHIQTGLGRCRVVQTADWGSSRLRPSELINLPTT